MLILFKMNLTISVCIYSTDWQLQFSVSKCVWLQLGILDFNVNLTLHGFPLPRVDVVKDLGVWISSDLKFKGHVNKICHNATAAISKLFQCFRSSDHNFLKRLYFSFVIPILENASPVWNPQYVTYIDKLERVQKFFTRKVLQNSTLDYNNRLNLLSMKSLEYRRMIIDLKLVHGIIHEKSCLNFNDFLEFQRMNNTRSFTFISLSLEIPIADCRKHFFASRVVPVWNSLPSDVVTSPNIYCFIRKLNNINLDRFLVGSYL